VTRPAPPLCRRAARSLLRRAILVAFAALLLAACGRQAGQRLTITGSTSMTPFVEQLAETYQHSHIGTAIDVQGLGSSAGVRAAADGVSELGMSSRALSTEEGQQLEQFLMARDALAIIVHPQNPVQALSRSQIRDIFAGRVTTWDALGGASRPIVVVTREAGSGTYSAFEELVMDGEPITIAALRQGSNGSVRQIVADDRDAIGYISLGIVDPTVRAVAIDGVSPGVEQVQAGAYQLVRPFLVVWQRGRTLSPLADAFLTYMSSPEGQATLSREGLVPGEGERE
jgi:phosphate transport system substrate-binding protein